MKFAAAGDAIIQRRIQKKFEGYEELSPYISDSDASFFNLETTLNYEGECYGSQFSGGTYIRANPEVLSDIMEFGFNLTSFNNNHAMDFSYPGFLATLDYVNEAGIVHAGAGMNLAEASAPKYLETKNGRVALISINANFDPSMMAGEASPRFEGRPGINGLRIEKYLRVKDREFEFVKELAEKTGINVERNIIVKEGYYAPTQENEALLGTMRFVKSDRNEYVMEANKADVERVMAAIEEARFQADYVMVSVHSHHLSGDAKEIPADFLVDFAHACVDAGANAVIGHGPHLLRPIEVYRDCPIFYSLGDFVLELYSVEIAPDDFYRKHGLPTSSGVKELIEKRSQGFKVGLMEDERMFLTVIPLWESEGGKLKSLKLVPVELKMRGHKSEVGLPRLSENPEKILKYIGDMSEPYGVKMKLSADGLIECSWK